MGLFSSSYKYYAYASSDNLFDEDTRPNTVLSLMISGIIGSSASPSESIILGLNTNLYARGKSMFKYAAKEGGYIFGFPTTTFQYRGITTELLTPYIEAEAGGAITFHSTYIGEFDGNPAYFVEKSIWETYMDPAYFPWPDGDPLDTSWSYQDDTIEIPVTNPDTLAYYISNNQFNFTNTGSNYQVTFPYTDNLGMPQTFSVASTYNLAIYQTGTWIMIRYRLDSDPLNFRYWTYRIGSDAIPGLDNAIEVAELNMQFLPIAVMMHDTVWFDEAGIIEWEETLDRLLKDIVLDPYEIKEEFLEQQEEDDASGDSTRSNAETWDFFIQFAVPLKTDFRGGREYLFKFYEFLRTRVTWTTFQDYQDFLANGAGGVQPASNMSIEEGEEYTGYIARYAWSYISTKTVEGEFTPPGFTDPLRPRRLWSETYDLGDLDYTFGLNLVHGEGNYLIAPAPEEEQEHAYTIVTRMNEDGTHTHILMMGPSMEYQINTSQEPVGVGAGGYVDYRYRFVDCELFPDDPEEDSEFRWPVHMASLKEVSAMQREAALSDGLCATVFLVERIKVKWYQKSFFKWLIIIIVIIIIVLAWQYELLPSLAALAGAAAGATALGLWAIYVVVVFALGFLISFAGGLIGGRLGTVFVIVASLMVAGVNPFNNLAGSWGSLAAAPGWGTALSFIQAMSPFLNVGMAIYQDISLAKIESDMRDFIQTAKEKNQQLQDAWDAFGDIPSWLNPMDLVRAQQLNMYMEDPDNFFARTLNANPGILGYDLINNFAEIALMLPEDGSQSNIIEGVFEDFEKQRGAT